MKEYGVLFRTYIERSLAFAQAQVSREGELSDPERKQVWHTLTYALALPEAWEETSRLLCALAPRMERAGFREGWIQFLERGVEQSRIHEDKASEIELGLQLGYLYIRLRRWEAAQAILKQIVVVSQERDDSESEAYGLAQLAQVARYVGDRYLAIGYLDRVSELTPSEIRTQALCYGLRGFLAGDIHDWESAVSEFTNAMSLWRQIGAFEQLAIGALNIGWFTIAPIEYDENIDSDNRQKRLQKGKEYLAIALENALISGVKHSLGFIYNSLGRAYDLAGEKRRALEMYSAAEEVFNDVSDFFGLAKVQHNLGIHFLECQEITLAVQALEQAVKLSKRYGPKVDFLQPLAELGFIYLKLQRHEIAISTFKDGLEVLDQQSVEGDLHTESIRLTNLFRNGLLESERLANTTEAGFDTDEVIQEKI